MLKRLYFISMCLYSDTFSIEFDKLTLLVQQMAEFTSLHLLINEIIWLTVIFIVMLFPYLEINTEKKSWPAHRIRLTYPPANHEAYTKIIVTNCVHPDMTDTWNSQSQHRYGVSRIYIIKKGAWLHQTVVVVVRKQEEAVDFCRRFRKYLAGF